MVLSVMCGFHGVMSVWRGLYVDGYMPTWKALYSDVCWEGIQL